MSDEVVEQPNDQPTPPAPFETVPYRPDGGFTPLNSALLLGIYLVAGTALGIAAYFVSKAIWLIMIFPLLIGGILGGIGILVVKATKVRNPLVAGLAGFLGGCLSMLAMHYAEYLHFRSDVPPDIGRVLELPEEQREIFFKLAPPNIQPELRRGAKMYATFAGFMDGRAEEGVQIKRSRDINGKGSNLGYTGSWIYWGLEVLIIAGISLGMVWSAASKPFCTACGTWKTPQQVATLPLPAAHVHQAVRDGEPWRVLNDPAPETVREVCDVVIESCPNCQADAPIEVKAVRRTWNKKNEVQLKEMARHTYPGDALPVVLGAFQPIPGIPAELTPPSDPPAAEAEHKG